MAISRAQIGREIKNAPGKKKKRAKASKVKRKK